MIEIPSCIERQQVVLDGSCVRDMYSFKAEEDSRCGSVLLADDAVCGLNFYNKICQKYSLRHPNSPKAKGETDIWILIIFLLQALRLSEI